MKKVFVVGGPISVSRMFSQSGFEVVSLISQADLVCFTGGEDVHPSLYGDTKVHPQTWPNAKRDMAEQHIFMYCFENKIPMVGICRGGQFLNVMSGGRMYQHVTKHTNSHNITDSRTGEVIYVSSTHHQMMLPGKTAQVIAFASNGGQREFLDGEIFSIEKSPVDYEVLFYEETKSLCFQPHPEMIMPDQQMTVYFFNLIKELLVKNETVVVQ